MDESNKQILNATYVQTHTREETSWSLLDQQEPREDSNATEARVDHEPFEGQYVRRKEKF